MKQKQEKRKRIPSERLDLLNWFLNYILVKIKYVKYECMFTCEYLLSHKDYSLLHRKKDNIKAYITYHKNELYEFFDGNIGNSNSVCMCIKV